jgi:RimJ/RimL family protein N-acetyltransferase
MTDAQATLDPTAGRRGDKVHLRTIRPGDLQALYQVELDGLGPRWRFKGATPSFEQFSQALWTGVLAQYLVADNTDNRIIGMVTAYNANHRDRWAYLAVARFRPDDRSGLLLHGAALFIDHLFDTFDFEKLYAEVAEHNQPAFASAVGRLFEEEGRLRGHSYLHGRRWDEIILALYRQTWRKWQPVIMPRVLGGIRYQQTGGTIRPTRDWADQVTA